MSEYRCTQEDRIAQLNELIPALVALINYLKRHNLFLEEVSTYEYAVSEAKRLLSDGFAQEELRSLQKSVPDLFYRHKEWIPPLENKGDYSTEAAWFTELEKYLTPALSAAGVLTVVGYY